MEFNQKPSTIMHLDLNSCFATIEQQANPLLRGRPIAVAAYVSSNGCILAPSIEAKKFGVKTGFRVREGKAVCPDLIILPPDPPKYRYIHLKLRQLLDKFTADVTPRSIDEFVLDFADYPGFHHGLIATGRKIKSEIKKFVGDWLTVSIGIGPNRFLAKLASNLKKPDGLEEINYQNYFDVYSRLKLPDLHGINNRLTARLCSAGIYTVPDFLTSDIPRLRSVFHSIAGYYWYLRLRGFEIDNVDFGRKSFGNMYSLPKHYSDSQNLAPILHKLIEKMSFRLRRSGYQTRGLYLGILYTDHSFWHYRRCLPRHIFAATDIYRIFYRLLLRSPLEKPVANIAISCFDLTKDNAVQLDLFNTISRRLNLSSALDNINSRYGHFVISPAAMIDTTSLVPDRIGFGNIGDLTEFVTS
jgi:DNA polymerase-4